MHACSQRVPRQTCHGHLRKLASLALCMHAVLMHTCRSSNDHATDTSPCWPCSLYRLETVPHCMRRVQLLQKPRVTDSPAKCTEQPRMKQGEESTAGHAPTVHSSTPHLPAAGRCSLCLALAECMGRESRAAGAIHTVGKKGAAAAVGPASAAAMVAATARYC